MQTLADKARHVAEWGGRYQIVVDLRQEFPRASVRIQKTGGEEVVLMSELPRRTVEQAVQWAAEWLGQHGCQAFVDGKPRNLADFLFFVPDGV